MTHSETGPISPSRSTCTPAQRIGGHPSTYHRRAIAPGRGARREVRGDEFADDLPAGAHFEGAVQRIVDPRTVDGDVDLHRKDGRADVANGQPDDVQQRLMAHKLVTPGPVDGQIDAVADVRVERQAQHVHHLAVGRHPRPGDPRAAQLADVTGPACSARLKDRRIDDDLVVAAPDDVSGRGIRSDSPAAPGVGIATWA